MASIWEEVKSRKIFKAATIYAAIAWGIIQIADVLIPVLGIANWVMSSMVLMAFSGFPVALLIGWMLDLQIERKHQAALCASNEESSEFTIWQNKKSRFAELAVISVFGFCATLLYYNSVSEPVEATINSSASIQHLIQPEMKQKTIAVLPFANFSEVSQDEYFADGLTEELLNVLARNKKLRVAARTSSFQYKNTNINVKTIASELGVQYILEGSIRRSGDLIRVTVQLIKADEDVHIFSNSWDRNITSVFQVQDEIALAVMQQLQVSLLGESEPHVSDIGTLDIAAFADYSRGLAFLRNRTKTDFESAIEYFNAALLRDAEYAEAMAMLAEAYLLQANYGLRKSADAAELAKPLLEKAFNLNSNLGSAHAVRGLMKWQLAGEDKQKSALLTEAKKDLEKAIDINPSLAEAYMWFGSILQYQGLFVEGTLLRKKAFEIDPQSAVAGYNRAQDLVKLGNYKQAMEVFNTVIRNNPNYPNAYSIAGDVSFAVGQIDQSYSMYRRMSELGDDRMSWLINSAKLYIPMGEFQLAQQNIDELKNITLSNYPEKFAWLQVTLWIASKNLQPFYQWTETFAEDSDDWEQRLWRGYAAMSQKNWKFAVDDLTQALGLMRKDNAQRIDEHTVRTQLFLTKAYLQTGDLLKAEQFLNQAGEEMRWLEQQGFNSQVLRYQQATHAVLSGNSEQAISLLRQAVQEGFIDLWWAESDPAFQQLKTTREFIAIKDEFKIRLKLMQNSIEAQFGKLVLGQ